MNRELLKRIAKEAGMIGDKSGMFYAIDDHNVGGVDLEKFAESIVQECVRYVNEDYQRDFETLWREDLSNGIMKHFGIE